MNRTEQARQWVESLSAEQQQQALKEAKAKYSKQLRPQVALLMKKGLPKKQKQVAVNRLLLTTMWLEEHEA